MIYAKKQCNTMQWNLLAHIRPKTTKDDKLTEQKHNSKDKEDLNWNRLTGPGVAASHKQTVIRNDTYRPKVMTNQKTDPHTQPRAKYNKARPQESTGEA